MVWTSSDKIILGTMKNFCWNHFEKIVPRSHGFYIIIDSKYSGSILFHTRMTNA
jgi:hypothetical protein